MFGAPAAAGDGKDWGPRQRLAAGRCLRRQRAEAFPARCLRKASSRGWLLSAAEAWAARWRITAAVRRLRRLRRRTREEPAVGAAHRGSVADSFGGTVADAAVAVVAHAGGCGGREAWHVAAAAAADGERRKGGDVVGGGGDDDEHPGGPVAGPAAQASSW